jgi:hypothetical protein
VRVQHHGTDVSMTEPILHGANRGSRFEWTYDDIVE